MQQDSIFDRFDTLRKACHDLSDVMWMESQLSFSLFSGFGPRNNPMHAVGTMCEVAWRHNDQSGWTG